MNVSELEQILTFVLLSNVDDDYTYECSHCSVGDYIFGENVALSQIAGPVLRHVSAHHNLPPSEEEIQAAVQSLTNTKENA